ncbi:MAG: N-acetylmuramoyl-L-alanine amidase [Pseudoalteromonas sp.]
MFPEYIVVHTAAFNGKNCDSDMIDAWHKARNWSGIGYHFVIINDKHSEKADGSVESGRPTNKSGAHALGLNSRSLGICCIGHGDKDDFTPAQYKSLYSLISRLMREFAIPADKVIGHRELNQLADRDIISSRYRTSKSCPGTKVDMEVIRQQLLSRRVDTEGETAALSGEHRAAIANAIATLQKHRAQFPNAQDELDEFIHHPEVLTITR